MSLTLTLATAFFQCRNEDAVPGLLSADRRLMPASGRGPWQLMQYLLTKGSTSSLNVFSASARSATPSALPSSVSAWQGETDDKGRAKLKTNSRREVVVGTNRKTRDACVRAVQLRWWVAGAVTSNDVAIFRVVLVANDCAARMASDGAAPNEIARRSRLLGMRDREDMVVRRVTATSVLLVRTMNGDASGMRISPKVERWDLPAIAGRLGCKRKEPSMLDDRPTARRAAPCHHQKSAN